MRKISVKSGTISFLLMSVCSFLPAQQGFFLDTWKPKNLVLPGYTDAAKTTKTAGVSITIEATDTLTKIPLYIFGDNANAYTSSMSENKTLMKRIKDRNMGVLRGPSGSISDVYFWNRSQYTPPTDVPEVLLAGGAEPGWEWYGKRPNSWDAGWTMDVDSFYSILKQTGVTGLITVNYGYARYGTSENPVAQAAHMAADWVRYDNGRTKFWEIGNEVSGSWEAGYRIDTNLNKDGQPEYITGTLYGRHCRVFIDSMKAAATEIGAEIFIGAVTAETANSGPVNWNKDLMKEAGDDIDFYIIHSYFTPYNQNSNASVILKTPPQTQGYINYLKSCAAQADKPMRPVALTEYNIFATGSKQGVSQIGGMFAVMVTGEAIMAGLGEASRWDLANGYNNGDDHGMFSYGGEPDVTLFSPRPAFFYLYYMQKYLGDVLLKTTIKGTNEISAYSSAFNSGHVSTIIANAGTSTRIVRVNIKNATVGERYYTYTLVGGTDVPADPLMPFSRKVIVNGTGPTGVAGGPLTYETLKAISSVIDGEIVVEMPPFSVSYLVADTGSNTLVVNDTLYPVVQWNNPVDIVYGTNLSATQLNASANMSGSYVYNPASGTILNAGNGIELTVTFTPTDITYTPVTKTVTINVYKKRPVVQWNNPSDIPQGTALDAAQLNATANVDGTFEYLPPAGTILDTGSAQALKVTFTPTDTNNFTITTRTVHIDVFSVTGVTENPEDQIRIYPVPVSDKLVISGLSEFGTKRVTLQIISIDGTLFYHTLVQVTGDSETVKVTEIPAGMYMLQLISDGKRIIKRFVKL